MCDLPGSKTPLPLDLGEVIFDGDAVVARAEVEVETGNVELGRQEALG